MSSGLSRAGVCETRAHCAVVLPRRPRCFVSLHKHHRERVGCGPALPCRLVSLCTPPQARFNPLPAPACGPMSLAQPLVALPYLGVSFRLVVACGLDVTVLSRCRRSKSVVIRTAGKGRLRDVLAAVFGAKQLNSLVEWKRQPADSTQAEKNSSEDGSTASAASAASPAQLAGVKVSGWLSKPVHGLGRGASDRQFVSVNRREFLFSMPGRLPLAPLRDETCWRERGLLLRRLHRPRALAPQVRATFPSSTRPSTRSTTSTTGTSTPWSCSTSSSRARPSTST